MSETTHVFMFIPAYTDHFMVKRVDPIALLTLVPIYTITKLIILEYHTVSCSPVNVSKLVS